MGSIKFKSTARNETVQNEQTASAALESLTQEKLCVRTELRQKL